MHSSLGIKWTDVCRKYNAWHTFGSKIEILQVFIECRLHTGTVLGIGDIITDNYLLYLLLQLLLFSPRAVPTDRIVSFSPSPACLGHMYSFSILICAALFLNCFVCVYLVTLREHKLLNERKRNYSRSQKSWVLNTPLLLWLLPLGQIMQTMWVSPVDW